MPAAPIPVDTGQLIAIKIGLVFSQVPERPS
jgi:hypothetical protein